MKDFYDPQINTCVHQSIYNSFEKDKLLPQNRTIINLSENGTTIQTNYVLPSSMSDNVCMDSSPTTTLVPDKKTVVVDVHRSDVESKNRNHENITHIECKNEEIPPPLRKVPSNSSIVSLTNSTSSSLSNAISQELQKRSQVKSKYTFETVKIRNVYKKNLLLIYYNICNIKLDSLSISTIIYLCQIIFANMSIIC